jgi:hypothetical protein
VPVATQCGFSWSVCGNAVLALQLLLDKLLLDAAQQRLCSLSSSRNSYAYYCVCAAAAAAAAAVAAMLRVQMHSVTHEHCTGDNSAEYVLHKAVTVHSSLDCSILAYSSVIEHSCQYTSMTCCSQSQMLALPCLVSPLRTRNMCV